MLVKSKYDLVTPITGWHYTRYLPHVVPKELARKLGHAATFLKSGNKSKELPLGETKLAFRQHSGYSFQKAQFVSDHLDEARRQAWLMQEWLQILRAAKRWKAWILFGDDASFPQWGNLSYTRAKRGQTPTVKTAGKRKASKTFGVTEFFLGRLFHQGIEGKFNAQSYQAFLLSVLAQTTEHLFLIQDGAKYHACKASKAFFAQHQDRLTVFQHPSYSPDYNPIEYLWRKTKKRATHNKCFEQFGEVITSVEQALEYFARSAEALLDLFNTATSQDWP